MLKGLLFDLDGVLTNSAKFHLTAWNNLAKELGIHLLMLNLTAYAVFQEWIHLI